MFVIEAPRPAVRYLSVRALMARWDCSRRSVYRALDEMVRLGLYSGAHLGGRRVAISAVESYEACRERHETRAAPGRSAAAASASFGRASTSLIVVSMGPGSKSPRGASTKQR